MSTGGDTAFVSYELDGGVKDEVVDGALWDCLLYMATTAITATIPTSHFHPEDESDVPDEGFSDCCLDAATGDGVDGDAGLLSGFEEGGGSAFGSSFLPAEEA